MYQALYRKWRPRTFDEISGQEHITKILSLQCRENRVSHAYLFCGTRGTQVGWLASQSDMLAEDWMVIG